MLSVRGGSTKNKGDKYSAPKEYYRQIYGNKSIFTNNGILGVLGDLYSKLEILHRLIRKDSKVIDMGCGNALVLKLLLNTTRHKIIPFGVDFIKESIMEAKESIIPEFKENFYVSNVLEFRTKERFDLVISCPSYVTDEDFEPFEQHLRSLLSKDGILAFILAKDDLQTLHKRKREAMSGYEKIKVNRVVCWFSKQSL